MFFFKYTFLLAIVINVSFLFGKDFGKTITISGEISGVQSDSIFIFDLLKNKNAFYVNKKGAFNGKIKVQKAAFYTLVYNKNSSYIFLSPNKDLWIEFDANSFNESLYFKGDGAAANNYLFEKALLDNQEYRRDFKSLFSKNTEDFIAAVKDIENQKTKYLLDKKNIDKNFIKLEEKNIKYESWEYLLNYPRLYHSSTNKEAKINDAFKEAISSFEIDNMKLFNTVPSYRNALYYRMSILNDFNKEKELLNKTKETELQQFYANALIPKIRSTNPRIHDYYELIKPYLKGEELAIVEQQYLFSRPLTKGSPAPDFELENFNGGKTALDDFKGKYVLLDIWATWCGPCKIEIPRLKKLEEELNSDEIAFVSISVDKQKMYKRWRKMVEKQEMNGVQLIVDETNEKRFNLGYQVRSIPRFVLIDKEGKIINANAPKPSSGMLKPLLESLIN